MKFSIIYIMKEKLDIPSYSLNENIVYNCENPNFEYIRIIGFFMSKDISN